MPWVVNSFLRLFNFFLNFLKTLEVLMICNNFLILIFISQKHINLKQNIFDLIPIFIYFFIRNITFEIQIEFIFFSELQTMFFGDFSFILFSITNKYKFWLEVLMNFILSVLFEFDGPF